VAEKLQAAGAGLNVVVSALATTEAGRAIVKGLPGYKSLAEGVAPSGTGMCLCTLDQADFYIVVNTDLAKQFPVASFAVKRGVRGRGARLIVLDDAETGLDGWATRKWPPKESAQAIELAAGAQTPVIVYGPAGAKRAAELAAALPKSKRVAFAPGGNTLGLIAAGITATAPQKGASTFYVLADEMAQPSAELMPGLEQARFVAVQACYREPWQEVADVILPTPTNYEKDGTIINTEGQTLTLRAGITHKLTSEVAVIELLSELIK